MRSRALVQKVATQTLCKKNDPTSLQREAESQFFRGPAQTSANRHAAVAHVYFYGGGIFLDRVRFTSHCSFFASTRL